MIEPPGHRSKDIIDRDCNVMPACLARPYPLVVDRARGSIITDVEGREYIDFVAGIAVMNAGHSNPVVSSAISAQMEKIAHCGFPDFYIEPPYPAGRKAEKPDPI